MKKNICTLWYIQATLIGDSDGVDFTCIDIFPFYALWPQKMYKIYVYCKHCLIFFCFDLKKGLLKMVLNIATYRVLWLFFFVRLIFCVTSVCCLLLPKVYLIFASFAQCRWLQVISLRQTKFQQFPRMWCWYFPNR